MRRGDSAARAAQSPLPTFPSRESIRITRHDLAAGARGQVAQDIDVDALAEKAHRAIAERGVYAAGMKAVNRSGAVHAVVRIGIDRSGILAVGDVDPIRAREDRAVGVGADQG